MIKYKVIKSIAIEDFEERVSQHLTQGWKLQGNLVVDHARKLYYQAVTKQT